MPRISRDILVAPREVSDPHAVISFSNLIRSDGPPSFADFILGGIKQAE
jgi:hypothetical protein